jgi:hypothetical protein
MAVNRKPNTNCDLCNKEIYRRPSTLLKNKGKHCSKECSNKVYKEHFRETSKGPNKSKGLIGDKNPAWKGGVTQFKKKGNYKGINYIRCNDETKDMARKDGYIMEHRLVMYSMCGFLLTRTEVVHHKDHNPSNNNIDNLELWPDNASHKRAEWNKITIGCNNRIKIINKDETN